MNAIKNSSAPMSQLVRCDERLLNFNNGGLNGKNRATAQVSQSLVGGWSKETHKVCQLFWQNLGVVKLSVIIVESIHSWDCLINLKISSLIISISFFNFTNILSF